MLTKSDLKVIKGGALDTSGPSRTFVDAHTTDTRLMGVIVIYIDWDEEKNVLFETQHEAFHQFFYIETSEEGIESYKSVRGDDVVELYTIKQSMEGGLGANRVSLTQKEAFFLIQLSASINKEQGLVLPDDMEEYAFILEDVIEMSKEEEQSLFKKICGEITNYRQMVNYFLMRYFARDFYPVDMLSSQKIDRDLLSVKGSATLCLNKIDIGNKVDGTTSYLNESVIEDERGYCIVMSEVKIKDNLVSSLEILTEFSISSVEAAMKLARPEFVSVYEIAGCIDNVEDYLDDAYVKAQRSMTEGGKLYVSFAADNSHVDCDLYRLNDDVEEIVYLTVEDQLVVGAYTLERIKQLELKLRESLIGAQLIDTGKFEFKEPILYDYTLGIGNDFIGYVEDIMGLDEDDDE